MLTKYDEFLCHQIESTFDHVGTSAREWTERVILHFGDQSGKFHFSAGFGLYPNRNIIDAFGIVNIDRRHTYVVRASRALRPQADEVRVGPFSYELIEPWKQMRCRLDENPHGFSYDLVFEGTMPPSEEDVQFTRHKGRVVENVQRYVQAGRGRGRITVEGTSIEVKPGTCFVGRDHSWGVRRTGAEQEAGVEPTEWPPGHLYSWGVFQFPQWGAAYHIREDSNARQSLTSGSIFSPYSSGRAEIRLVGVDHEFQFQPDLRKIAGGKLLLTGADGSRKQMSFRPLNFTCLSACGYHNYRGFTHGHWMGQEWMDGFKLDLSDPQVLREVSFLSDESLELRCGDEVGYGVFEQVIVGKYPRYGFQGY